VRSLAAAKALVNPATHVRDCFTTVSEFASPFCRYALRDLRTQRIMVRCEQRFALLQEPQGLAHDLVDGLEVSGLDLCANQLFQFVGQRRQVHMRHYAHTLGGSE
jgi:hypothetical protein